MYSAKKSLLVFRVRDCNRPVSTVLRIFLQYQQAGRSREDSRDTDETLQTDPTANDGFIAPCMSLSLSSCVVLGLGPVARPIDHRRSHLEGSRKHSHAKPSPSVVPAGLPEDRGRFPASHAPRESGTRSSARPQTLNSPTPSGGGPDASLLARLCSLAGRGPQRAIAKPTAERKTLTAREPNLPSPASSWTWTEASPPSNAGLN